MGQTIGLPDSKIDRILSIVDAYDDGSCQTLQRGYGPKKRLWKRSSVVPAASLILNGL
jgi:hypothetical protein